MRVLRVRNLVRTANTPVGDYAERICCDRFGLERKGFSEKSVDAVDAKGIRYQVKGRRLTPENRSRQLGAIRDVEKEPSTSYSPCSSTRTSISRRYGTCRTRSSRRRRLWMPHKVVKEASFVARTNSTRFVLTKKRRN